MQILLLSTFFFSSEVSVVEGRLRVFAWVLLLRAPWPSSLLCLEPFHCCAAQATAVHPIGLDWFSLLPLEVALQEITEGRGSPWCSLGHGSSKVDKEADCYTQWGGSCSSDWQHVPAGWLKSQSATNSCESVLSVHTHWLFLPKGIHCTMASGLGWVPTQLQDASGATKSPPSWVLAPSDSLLSHLPSHSCGETPQCIGCLMISYVQ